MKKIPLYKFYKHKYGDELLIDVLDLDYIKAGIHRYPVHRETFFCIILITGGRDEVAVNGHSLIVQAGDVICSRPGEIWKPNPNLDGNVLIFEEQFLLSFFNDPLFLERFTYLHTDRPSPFLSLDDILLKRLTQLFDMMKSEISDHEEKDQHILRAMLYETLMLLARTTTSSTETSHQQKKRRIKPLHRTLYGICEN